MLELNNVFGPILLKVKVEFLLPRGLISWKMALILKSSLANAYTSIILNMKNILKHVHIVLLNLTKFSTQTKIFGLAQSILYLRVVFKKSLQNRPRMGLRMTSTISGRIPASKSYSQFS